MENKLRLAKGFFIVLFFLAASITLLSLIIPGRVVVTKSAEILASPAVVIDSLQQLNTWVRWFPVLEAYKENISNLSVSEKFISWMHNGIASDVEILEQQTNAIRFLYRSSCNPVVENMITCFPIDNKPNASNVEWTAVTKLKWYPWEKFSGLFIERITGSSYEYGLTQLNKLMNTN